MLAFSGSLSLPSKTLLRRINSANGVGHQVLSSQEHGVIYARHGILFKYAPLAFLSSPCTYLRIASSILAHSARPEPTSCLQASD